MKRRVVLILLLLIAGAIVNVAVAWGCIIRPGTAGGIAAQSDAQTFATTWQRLAPAHWGEKPTRGHHADRFGSRWAEVSAGQWPHTLADGTKVSVSRYTAFEKISGWPLYALRSVHLLDYANPGWLANGSVRLPIAMNGRPHIEVPSRPIWPGFAINTVFYAVVLWLLFAAPFALRRRLRIRRGLCPKCAYPVGASEVCTECGAAVSA